MEEYYLISLCELVCFDLIEPLISIPYYIYSLHLKKSKVQIKWNKMVVKLVAVESTTWNKIRNSLSQ